MLKTQKKLSTLIVLSLAFMMSACEEKTYQDTADKMMSALEMPVMIFTLSDHCAGLQLNTSFQEWKDASSDQRKKWKTSLHKYDSLVIEPTDFLGENEGTLFEVRLCSGRVGVQNKDCDSSISQSKVAYENIYGKDPMQPGIPLPKYQAGVKITKAKHIHLTPQSTVMNNAQRVVYKTNDKYLYDTLNQSTDRNQERLKQAIESGSLTLVKSYIQKPSVDCGKLASFKDL